MRTLNYESENMCAEIPAHRLHEELMMARVAYAILGISGVKECNRMLSILEEIMADPVDGEED